MSGGLIRGSKGSRSFKFSAILALYIPRSGWQFEWVRCRTASALKFAAIVSYFTTEWFSWMGIVLVLATIVIQFWQEPQTLLQSRHFRTQLLPEVFEVKWIVVLLNRFSKFLTDPVREKANLSFAARTVFKSSVNFPKISFENELRTKKGRFNCIFKFKRIFLTFVQSSSF